MHTMYGVQCTQYTHPYISIHTILYTSIHTRTRKREHTYTRMNSVPRTPTHEPNTHTHKRTHYIDIKKVYFLYIDDPYTHMYTHICTC